MSRAVLLLGCLLATGCGNPQRVTETTDVQTPTAPAVQRASQTGKRMSEFKETESGLKYNIVREGDASKKPTQFSTVRAHYKGWLDDGTIFDSSYDRGEATEFPLQGVIPGWTEGLQLIGEGGEIELEIPGKLGYGPQGMPPAGIGPNATLHFKVELVDVK